MLFIMGALGKLIDALKSIASLETLKMLCRLDFKGLYNRIQWRFLIGLVLGILVSFATLAKLFVWLLEKHQMYTFAFFFGLIVASVITVNRQMKKWSVPAVISALISTAAAYTVIMAENTALFRGEEMDFILDRPFVFVITGRDGLPLFVGVVNQPN